MTCELPDSIHLTVRKPQRVRRFIQPVRITTQSGDAACDMISQRHLHGLQNRIERLGEVHVPQIAAQYNLRPLGLDAVAL